MSELVAQLAVDHMVILDTTPVLPVTDAGLLTATCDGALLVMAVGRTHKEQVRHSAKVIAQVNGNLLGSVLNKARPQDIGSVYYGAGYGSYGSDYYGYVEGSKKGKGKRSAGKRGAAAAAQDTTPSRSPEESVVVPEAPVAPARPVTEPAREVAPASVAETTVTPQQSAGDQAYRTPVEPDAFGVEPEVQEVRGRRSL